MRSAPPRAPLHTLVLIALPAALLVSPGARADVTEHASVIKYPVRVGPALSLDTAVQAASPIRLNGQTVPSFTTWSVQWHFDWARQPDGRCSITKVNTVLTTQTQLPELVDATPAEQLRFDRWLRGLTVYEQGHRDIGRAAANEAERRIVQTPPMHSCRQLEATAHAAAHRAVDEYLAQEQHYDQSTQRGKTLGAVLPP